MRRRKPVPPKLRSSVAAEWNAELRRESRGKIIRWGLQALVLLIFLGAPYARGKLRARELQAVHAKVAACMYGQDTASIQAGTVGDPSGHFAAMFLQRPDDWPARCEPELRELARDPARFVFPSVKAAEADVQKAAQVILAELDDLPDPPRAGDEVPLRPLWGLQMLRDAVVAHADAAGVSVASAQARSAAASSHVPSTPPTPTFLDIDAALDATVKVWGDEVDLQVAAFDPKGVSYLRLKPDRTTRARLPRAGSLRSVVRQDNGAYLVWSTAFDKCGATRCAGKSIGLAPMPALLTKIPEPRWVAAHPFGSPQRSLAWHGARMWLSAANLDGTARLVEFDTSLEPPDSQEKVPPLEPHATKATKLSVARDLVVFTDSAGALGALALEVGAHGRWALLQYREGASQERLIQLPEEWDSGWVRTCSASSGESAETRYFVVGSETAALFGYVREGVTTTWPLMAARIPPPARTDRDPAFALACSERDGLTVAFIESGVLTSATCARGETACASHTLSELATSVDIAYAGVGVGVGVGDDVLVAYSGAPDQPQVRLERLNRHGAKAAATTVPGPCWDRWGGMCGEPTLAEAGARLILAARSGAGLMALESSDAGRSWTELRSTDLVKPPGPHVLPRH